ncbi:MAG: M23 family metallopeptidase [Bacteroidia bacterium]|nr:M23 family metallopeptidase [Bacteroidia bacterium]MDW8015203.1 M23 family metallopeptidase [Bacteroidia bacterium]
MWHQQYRLIWIGGEGTFRRELRLPTWGWMILAAVFLTFLWILFAYTPLKYTIPGYPTRSFKEKYNQLLDRVRQLEQKFSQHMQMIEELRHIESVMRAAPQAVSLPLLPTLQSGQYILPIEGQISRRFQPSKAHWGVDISCGVGEPILAIAEGTVIFAEYSYETGYVIALQHPNGLLSIYKHNSRLLRQVGEKVRAGDVIALAGGLGVYSTAPHLHIETWLGGMPIDPLKLLAYE